MTRSVYAILALILDVAVCGHVIAEVPRELRVGRAGHAFDHLGGIGEQAEAAAASGATIIYATGLGGWGYQGLPAADELAKQRDAVRAYNRRAKERGIKLSLGYLCATSIVRLRTFDKNWSADFRGQFGSPPADWRQEDQHGNKLASWYGGDYEPACMNHPDWRLYEEVMVREQLEAGHDGIFFDNPTVHPEGCYCEHCMKRFAKFVRGERKAGGVGSKERFNTIDSAREYAVKQPVEFQRFRCTTAREFLAHMRAFSRSIKPNALVTCNNSLNSPDRLYAQCRTHGYNIWEMSQAEDFVLVEDMVAQPRVEADGQISEYGAMYKLLHGISHGKPVVAVTLANGDYHTPPNLVRLAMAEAAANNASYLMWPTWPETQRQRMIAAVRPQADWLREHAGLLNDATFRADVVLFLPFRRWTTTDHCSAADLATELTRANVQYQVIAEDNFDLSFRGGRRPVLVVESLAVLTPTEVVAVEAFQREGGRVVAADSAGWLQKARDAVGEASLAMEGPPTVRAIVRDQPGHSIVHLLNLNVKRLSSFEDHVNTARDIPLSVRVPFQVVREVTVQTADSGGTSGPVHFTARKNGDGAVVMLSIPQLETNAIVVIQN